MQNDTPAVKQDQQAHLSPAENGQNPVFGLPPEENDGSQETGSCPEQETLRQEDNQLRDKKNIPYSRFREVIDERNRLREKLDSYENRPEFGHDKLTGAPEPLSDEEMNQLWEQNPSCAAKVMFAQTISEFFENNRRKNESVSTALRQYPELLDSDHEISLTARDIIQHEMPHLRSNPDGIRIAAEMAAARYYKSQYEKMLKSQSNYMKNLHANRIAGTKGAFLENPAPPMARSYHDCLSAEEQRVAGLMGVPAESYAAQKRNSNRFGGKN